MSTYTLDKPYLGVTWRPSDPAGDYLTVGLMENFTQASDHKIVQALREPAGRYDNARHLWAVNVDKRSASVPRITPVCYPGPDQGTVIDLLTTDLSAKREEVAEAVRRRALERVAEETVTPTREVSSPS